jgi:MFS family permease
VNYSGDRDSIDNLINQLDFHCAPDFMVGLFGSFFLLGMVIGCLTLARMGDIYGRKKVFILGMVCQVAACGGLLVSRSAPIDYILMLVLGWAITGK